MGATATPLPWGETFSAVQQGVVDGLEGSDFTYSATKVHDTGKKNIALTRHFLGTAGVYISTEVWAKIPAEYQAIIETVFTEEADNMIARLQAKHGKVVTDLQAQGVTFTEVDRAAFEQRTLKIYDTLPGVNMGMYDQIQHELQLIRSAEKQAQM